MTHLAIKMKFETTVCITAALFLASCTTVQKPQTSSAPITQSEAKAEACPESLLEAGASSQDCACIENELYELGQKPGVLDTESGSTHALFGRETGKRKIAIGLLRHDAIEHCGLFDPNHVVAKNL